ncbi:MAG: septum formation initiator family protein [Alphaproteobacteria bacterium]
MLEHLHSSVGLPVIKHPLISSGFKIWLAPLIAVSLLVYFIYHLIQGERGLLSWYHLQQKTEEVQDQLTMLQQQKQIIERQVFLLNPSTLCLDMLEERVRNVLNFARGDDIIIFEDKPEKN